MKVQDLAKNLGQNPREFMKFLEEVSVRVKSPSAKLDPSTVKIATELFQEKKRLEEEKNQGGSQYEAKTIVLHDKTLTIQKLSQEIGIRIPELMKSLLDIGLMLSINSEIDFKTAQEIAMRFNVTLISDEKKDKEERGSIKSKLEKIEEQEIEDDIDALVERPPVVAIMGHVDHGKTLMLDTIRKANVVASEAGGITQHIGAYQVEVHGHKLTFLDTPGHAAFTALRARGAQVTDIAVLVVAADDGLKPQSLEAIDHARAAKVPIIVAVNKIDKPDANLDRCKQQLSEHDLVAEDWGGKTVVVPVSAKTGQGIDTLLEMIRLVADMLELRANPKGNAKGIVIESRLSKTRGPVATVLVKTGTLQVGDPFVMGAIYGKVKALMNDLGQQVKSAMPGAPVEIMGINEVPPPGELFEVVESERGARQLIDERELDEDKSSRSKRVSPVSLEAISKKIEEGALRQLNLVIKSDVHGSLEAITHAIGQIEARDVEVNIIRSATGPVTENDIMLARASNAILMSFNTEVATDTQTIADKEMVQIKQYKIIYEIIEDLQKTIEGMFKIEYEELERGRIEVRQLFSFSKVGTIAGSYVTSGEVSRHNLIRVLRGKDVAYDGKLTSLKRFKDDVAQVAQGFECGVVVNGFEFQVGDIVVAYEVKEKRK